MFFVCRDDIMYGCAHRSTLNGNVSDHFKFTIELLYYGNMHGQHSSIISLRRYVLQ